MRPIDGSSDRLVLVDFASFVATPIGATGLHSLEDLCVAPEGRIYAWDSGPGGVNGLGLVELSRTDGAALDVAAAGGSSDVLALAIDEVGELRGANFKLYSIDRASGAEQPISPNTQVSIEGLQYLSGMSRIDGALALERTGGLKRVNTTTGAVGPVFATLSGDFVGSAYRATSGQLGEYFVLRDAGATTELLLVDPSTGAATSRGMRAIDDVRAAYFDLYLSNTVFVIVDGGPGLPDVRRIVSLTTSTIGPAQTLVGCESITGASADFAARHVAWDEQKGFVAFNVNINSVPQDVTPGPAASVAIQTLRYDPLGRLFASNGALQRIGVVAETASPVGSSALGDLAGLDFLAHTQWMRPETYCTSSTNSLGCSSYISTAGPLHPSASEAAGFEVIAFNQLTDKQGLLFYGINGRSAVPFSSGFLCVKSPLRRTGIQTSGGTGGCSGGFSLDFNAWIASGADPALGAGVRVDAQYWSRDPAAASTTNVTSALEFEIAP